MVLSKIKVSGTSDLNCTKDGVKIDSTFLRPDFSTNDLFYKTTSLPPLNCKTYIESTVSSLCLLTPAAFRIQIRPPKSIFTVCKLEPFTTFIYQPKRLLNKSVTVNE